MIDFYTPDSFSLIQRRIREKGYNYETGTQIHFSPQGDKMLFFAYRNKPLLYAFDRENAGLTFIDSIDLKDPSSFPFFSFSPSGELLYLWHPDSMFQYDLAAADFNASAQLIDVYDGFLDPFPTGFAYGQLGPDCRIYIVATSSSQYMHLIDHPDRRGKACGFRQHGFHLPGVNYSTIPYYPNYRLDVGPVCDSNLVSSVISIPYQDPDDIQVYPNPVRDWLHISGDVLSNFEYDAIRLIDASGVVQRTWEDVLWWEDKSLDWRSFHPGIYLLQFVELRTGRFIVKRVLKE